ncbi:carbonic anhydrase [Rhodococcus sp. P1Y]|uniref:carbonic anhydrase n=1 Tax=Rhodococcus sp. P1Y TaxID=1302308 RepID=UPI000EB25F5C|nr:carbonic anhydrase [Rhodococcus sp. P1Y]AYJ52244.1 carbonic anhydrase [Rhodococcus sp. P1Y]
MPATNPVTAWKSLKDGNQRFVAGEPLHPSQGIEDRTRLAEGQHPGAILFGCADSRVAAEIIFDQGLGDMFVVRTAGHTMDSSVLGSIEYGVAVLGAPLIVVLGHDRCGAVKATIDALDSGDTPGGYIRDVVERVTPSVLSARRDGYTAVDDFEARHVEETANLLMQRSRIIADKVETGEVAIVGLTYRLSEGSARLREVIGDIGELP